LKLREREIDQSHKWIFSLIKIQNFEKSETSGFEQSQKSYRGLLSQATTNSPAACTASSRWKTNISNVSKRPSIGQGYNNL